MTRGLGWMLAIGLGGALVAGCRQREEHPVGHFNEPIPQKSQSPVGAAGDTGQGGSGGEGVQLERGWPQHTSASDDGVRDARGPYAIDRPQPIPRERRPAPLGVGPGSDSARTMAEIQLKSE